MYLDFLMQISVMQQVNLKKKRTAGTIVSKSVQQNLKLTHWLFLIHAE